MNHKLFSRPLMYTMTMTAFLLIGTGCSTAQRFFKPEIDYKNSKLVSKLKVPANLTPIQTSNRYLIDLPTTDSTVNQ
jgi:uncharacterized lipoprotein